MNTNKTYMQKPLELTKEWFVVDATNQTLGRLSSRVSSILRGKHKSTFTPNVDCGDKVIVINAKNIKLTGKKIFNKKYYNHSGYIGGLRTRTAGQLIESNPEEMIKRSIIGMLPHTRLGRKQSKNLYVYRDSKHLHHAQQPKKMNLD